MAAIARDKDCADAASSAVLQAHVALETFLSTWNAMRPAGAKRCSDPPKGKKRSERQDRKYAPSKFVHSWQSAATNMFGEKWKLPDRSGFEMLNILRNCICHWGSVPDAMIPWSDDCEGIVEYFTLKKFPIKPAPAPWIDRILNADVAEWAVKVAQQQISAVRSSWNAAALKLELQEWSDNLAYDDLYFAQFGQPHQLDEAVRGRDVQTVAGPEPQAEWFRTTRSDSTET